jgi:hypothetical protein
MDVFGGHKSIISSVTVLLIHLTKRMNEHNSDIYFHNWDN